LPKETGQRNQVPDVYSPSGPDCFKGGPIDPHPIGIQKHHRTRAIPATTLQQAPDGLVCIVFEHLDIPSGIVCLQSAKRFAVSLIPVYEDQVVKGRMNIDRNLRRSSKALDSFFSLRIKQASRLHRAANCSLPGSGEGVDVPKVFEFFSQRGGERSQIVVDDAELQVRGHAPNS